MASINRSGVVMKPNETLRLILTAVFGIVFGFLIGASLPNIGLSKINIPSLLSTIDLPFHEDRNSGLATQVMLNYAWASKSGAKVNGFTSDSKTKNRSKIYVPTNPRGSRNTAPWHCCLIDRSISP